MSCNEMIPYSMSVVHNYRYAKWYSPFMEDVEKGILLPRVLQRLLHRLLLSGLLMRRWQRRCGLHLLLHGRCAALLSVSIWRSISGNRLESCSGWRLGQPSGINGLRLTVRSLRLLAWRHHWGGMTRHLPRLVRIVRNWREPVRSVQSFSIEPGICTE